MNLRILLTIAWRNVIKSPKRAIMFGGAILLSTALLLISHALFNGSGDQIKMDMSEIVTGEVGVFWSSVLDYAKEESSRPFMSHFDTDYDAQNRAGLKALDAWLAAHPERVRLAEPYIMNQATLYAASAAASERVSVYADSARDFQRLLDRGILQASDPAHPLAYRDNTVWLSVEFAQLVGVKAGDRINLATKTMYGGQNALEMIVGGTFRNKAPWMNRTAFTTEASARLLMDLDPGFGSAVKLYLQPGQDQAATAAELNAVLQTSGGRLVAEPFADCARFFTTLSESQKSMFTLFVVVIFVVVGMGLQSTTRMVLFQRMREFGTLRAIGYSRRHCLVMVIMETLLLCGLALAGAVVLDLAVVGVLSLTGVQVPPGPMQYMFGGDHFFPRLSPADFGLSLGLISALALLAPFQPAGDLLYNAITDILAGRQRRVWLLIAIVRSWLKQPSRRAS
jgi:ABC-type lipoprotein release transport system permease subunit